MSIDLSRPLVGSMGHHDPLDGFITYNQLQMCAADDLGDSPYPGLNEEITDMANICKGKSWVTDDPLGIGGILCAGMETLHTYRGNSFSDHDRN